MACVLDKGRRAVHPLWMQKSDFNLFSKKKKTKRGGRQFSSRAIDSGGTGEKGSARGPGESGRNKSKEERRELVRAARGSFIYSQ